MLAATLLWTVGCGDAPSEPPYNVVVISIDSLRADHLGCYGYPRPTSPHLDALARDGVVYENAIAESSWTLPTHISMLTGLSSYVHGIEHDEVRLGDDVPRLAVRLREAGYRTKGIFSGPYLDPIFGFGVGFDEYEAEYGDLAADGPDLERDASEGAWRAVMRDANQRSHRTITSPAVTERAIEFIGRDAPEPFFLFLHYFDVHYDYIPPESLWREFDPDYDGEMTGDDFQKNPAIHPDMAPRDLEHLIALYDAEIRFTDQYIGMLLDALERGGLTDRTLVVVTSDHGEEFFEHGGKGHRHTLFDEVLKVPLVLRMPGRIPAGTRVPSLVRHIDLAPTILSLLEVPFEGALSGTSVVGDWSTSGGPVDRTAISRLLMPDRKTLWVSARTSSRKYVVNTRGKRTREMLYDLAEDPAEQRPLATRVLSGDDLQELSGFMDVLAQRESEEALLREMHGGARPRGVELTDDIQERLRSLGYIQ